MSNNTITVVFYEEGVEDSLLICEMIDVPRVGEFVTVIEKSGEVVSVEWEIVFKNGSVKTFAGVVLNITPANKVLQSDSGTGSAKSSERLRED